MGHDPADPLGFAPVDLKAVLNIIEYSNIICFKTDVTYSDNPLKGSYVGASSAMNFPDC